MNIVRCPRCLDDVTVPLRASPKALVRCPLCLEEYPLAEALGGLPPGWLVIDGSDGQSRRWSGRAGSCRGRAGGARGGDDYRCRAAVYGAALMREDRRRGGGSAARGERSADPRRRRKMPSSSW